MSDSEPVVSAIMATFNGRSVIMEAIESIAAQSGISWELIIVDDASTDGTADYVESFADARIRVIRNQTNRGSGASRNVAAASARGRYLAVVDDDDISAADRFVRCAEILEKMPSISVVATGLREFGSWGKDDRIKHAPNSKAISERLRKNKTPVGHPTVMLRKEEFLRVGGYDEACRRAQDYTLLARFRSDQFFVLPEPLVDYRIEYPLSLGFVKRNFAYHELAVRVVAGERLAELEPLSWRGLASALRSYLLVNGHHYLGVVKGDVKRNG